MRMKWMAAVMTAMCLGGAATAALADTVTLTFKGATGPTEPTSGGSSASVYPYEFSVNGSSTDTTLLCISFADEITNGESWMATVTQLSLSSSNFDKEEAYLFSLITPSTSSKTDAYIQFADWYLSDSSAVKDTTFYKENSTVINGYVELAEDEGLIQSDSFYEDFQLYTPVSGTYDPWNGYPDGIPQTFIGDAPPAPPPPPSPTPEPGSLALLGTGLLGMGGVMRRRMHRA